METTFIDPSSTTALRAATHHRLALLTPREREICLLHFVDGRPQTLVAEWLGITRNSLIEHIESAITKVPELIPLRTLARQKPPRVRVLHLSQLPPSDRDAGPFNIDEL